jgi:predicted HD superfamily hydrolase involved in NAD metabolism
MKIEQIRREVEKELPRKRWIHTTGVMQSAKELARRFGADSEKAELASLLHDYAKYWPADKMESMIRKYESDQDVLNYEVELWHGPAAAAAARVHFQITDHAVLDAIRYHTSGRVDMTTLEKVVCLADYIELNRDYDGVAHIRACAEQGLECGLIAGLDQTLSFLIRKGKKVFPQTILARNFLIDEWNARNGGSL